MISILISQKSMFLVAHGLSIFNISPLKLILAYCKRSVPCKSSVLKSVLLVAEEIVRQGVELERRVTDRWNDSVWKLARRAIVSFNVHTQSVDLYSGRSLRTPENHRSAGVHRTNTIFVLASAYRVSKAVFNAFTAPSAPW